MSSQIFKKIYPKDEFIEFIKNYTDNNKNYLLFSKSSYKKMKLENKCQDFFDTLLPYYHKSKKYYVERQPIYKHFVTVLKQICKINNIPYDSNISYSKSTYELKYKIYHTFKLK
tara:strand:+ start:224 stop:565 length:342 start_codon:yes stop_codon:yes gene_type:complete